MEECNSLCARMEVSCSFVRLLLRNKVLDICTVILMDFIMMMFFLNDRGLFSCDIRSSY